MMSRVVCVLALAGSTARAGGFIEGDVGLAVPFADDQYDSDVSTSFKAGVRVGTTTKFGAVDIGADITPYSNDVSNSIVDVSIQRYRFMLGARYVHALTPKARLFVRAAAGVDILHYSDSGSVFGVAFSNSQTDAGIALELAGGVLFDVGKVSLGAKLGLPIGMHFSKKNPNDPNSADLDYTAADIDFALIVNAPF